MYVDIDKGCVKLLEEKMFENADRTGASGNEQRGLGVEYHQGGWKVYINHGWKEARSG